MDGDMTTDAAEKTWGGGRTVLLADDQAEVRSFVEHCLLLWGHVVLTAKDGREALDLFEQLKGSIDLVILDSHMPGLDGLSCAKEILKQASQTPILLLTGSADRDVCQRAMAAGVRAVVEKPVSVGDLEAIVSRMLDGEDKANPVRVP